jgi:hypothetical protein
MERQMITTTRPMRVIAMAAIASAAALMSAGPAQAHPEVNVACDGLSNSRFTCAVGIRHAGPSVQIRWSVNGTRIPELDNRAFFTRGCQSGSVVVGRALVSDDRGSGEDSDSARCTSVAE